jgi:hypothetical protein
MSTKMPSTSTRSAVLAVATTFFLACSGKDASAPGSPTAVSVAAGAAAGTAVVSFTAPTSGDAPTGYTVTANPGGVTASGVSSPITVSGLAPRTAYTYSVVAANGTGASAPSTTGLLRFFDVVETFHEPMTQPNDTIFTGTFTFDTTSHAVSNLHGSLTQAMTKNGGVYGPPMTTVALGYQLDATAASPGGVDGLLVTTFALNTVNTFDPSGFSPADTNRVYYGLSAGAPNPKSGGAGNAYAMIFVNTADPTVALAQAQIDKLAYADCTAGGMMMSTCMTGTTMAGYMQMGTMMAEPVSQTTTER